MKDKYKFGLILALVILMASAMTVLGISIEDPTTTWEVSPISLTFPDGRVCVDGSFLIKDAFPNVTVGVGEGFFTEDFTVDGYPVTIEITTHEDNSFDFNIIGGVAYKVFVKGGADGGYQMYPYEPKDPDALNSGPVSYDTGLHDGHREGQDNFQDISHLDFCIVPKGDPLRAEKTADGYYDERHDWEFDKVVDKPSQEGWAGDLLEWTWTVTASETYEEENFFVEGQITIWNDNPYPVTVAVTDFLDDGTEMTVVCPALEVPAAVDGAAGELVCDYDGEPADYSAVANQATIESLDYLVDGTTAEADIDWHKTIVNATADISDLLDPELETPVTLNIGEGPWEWTETFDHTCSIDINDYSNGKYPGGQDNTVTLDPSNGDPEEKTRSTSYTCYAPEVTKDAAGSYTKEYDWGIKKTVSPTEQSGDFGETLPWEWKIVVTKDMLPEYDFLVQGSIEVSNPHPTDAIKVQLSDVLDDATVADITGCVNVQSFDLVNSIAVIDPQTTAVCSYMAEPSDRSAEYNTVNATLIKDVGTVDFSHTVGFGWTATVLNDTAEFSDPFLGLADTLSDGKTWMIPGSHTCSLNAADYADGGQYSGKVDNTAYLTPSDGSEMMSSASTTYTCYAGLVQVQKLTNSVVDETKVWTFELRKDGALLETGTTPPSLIQFDTLLHPGQTYTMCETNIPAGWKSVWSVGAPMGNDGTTCVDFVVPLGTARLTITVDNQYMDGEPRTPGYWKNWSTCSAGNQVATAEKNGGWEEGYWLLDDLLPVWVGDYPIESCSIGVLLLSKSDIYGDNRAYDPVFNMVTALVAAKLNEGAGAYVPSNVADAIFEADALLRLAGFDGTPGDEGTNKKPLYFDKKSDAYSEALYLQGVLDAYNNGMFMP